jgi:hypothetical protein
MPDETWPAALNTRPSTKTITKAIATPLSVRMQQDEDANSDGWTRQGSQHHHHE